MKHICHAIVLTTLAITNPMAYAHDGDSSCGMTCAQRVPEPLKQTRVLDRVQGAQNLGRGVGGLEDGSTIDILVVYTPQAVTHQGSQVALEAKINAGLAELNLAASNSMVNTLYRIVHMTEVSYVQSGSMGTQLAELRVPDDGVLDEVHTLRDLHKADIVMMVISSGNVCGIANIGVGPGNTPTPENAFSVVSSNCIEAPTSAFAHEIGHNMGIIHGFEENPCTNGSSRFAKGFNAPDESFNTVMGVGVGPRVLQFSNPSIDFNGQPTGVVAGDEFAADSAMALELASAVVSKYRNRDYNANGVEDNDEILAGTLNDCDGNGYPDFADQDFNKNGIPDACDIALETSLDLDLDGVPDEVEVSVIMVDDDVIATGTGDGWGNAISDLQEAFTLARASGGDISQIWIADGIYTPASNGQRAQGFDLISGVSLYGGFVGTETSIEDRIPGVAQSILSGDLNQDDGPNLTNREENTINTLFLFRQDNRLTLDGIIVEGGNANFEVNCGGFMFSGGGLCAFRGDIVINNCEFRNNTALKDGGVQITNFTKSRITNSWIHHNSAIRGVFWGANGAAPYNGWVGGIELNGLTTGLDNQFINNRVEFNTDNDGTSGCYIAGGNPIFANNIIANNTGYSIYAGAGLSVVLGVDIEIVNCTIANNTSPNAFTSRSSGITNSRSQVILKNTILWGNSAGGVSDEQNQYAHSGIGAAVTIDNSIVQGWTGGFPGTGSTGVDPMFVDSVSGDYTLGFGSGAIDMGDNAALPIDDLDLDIDGDTTEVLPVDYAGNNRFVDDPDTVDTGLGTGAIVDAGAFEYQVMQTCLADLNGDGLLNFFDVSAFLAAFAAQDPAADFNGDTFFNFFDVSAFLIEFGAGCP